jgi:DNA-binding PadR family transcriptional regulator
MSLNHLLLGVTRDGATGYEIKRAFGEGLRHIWNAELSQIYPALEHLEERGLLTSSKAPGERGAAKRIYKLSLQGAAELSRWLCSDPVLHDERHPFLAQLVLLGGLNEYAQTQKYFSSLEAALLARVQVMECLEEKWRRRDPAYPEVGGATAFHAQMTLEFGLASVRSALDCCRKCMKRLEKRMKRSRVRRKIHEKKRK